MNYEDLEAVYQDLDAEIEAERQHILSNPPELLEKLQDYVKVLREDEPHPMPVEILEVLDAAVSFSFRANKTSFLARVRADDGTEVLVWYFEGTYHPTRDDPGDFEAEMEWGSQRTRA